MSRKDYLTRNCRNKPEKTDDKNKDKKSKESNNGRKYNKEKNSKPRLATKCVHHPSLISIHGS